MKKWLAGFYSAKWVWLIFFIVVILYFLIMDLTKPYLSFPENCRTRCDPPAWATIRDWTLKYIGKDKLLARFTVFPNLAAHDGEISQFSIEINDAAKQPRKNLQYEYGTIDIVSDIKFLVSRNNLTFTMAHLPPARFQERFAKIELGHREIYRLIWQDFQKSSEATLRIPPTNLMGHLELDFSIDRRPKGTMLWSFTFMLANVGQIYYFLDAESGKLLKKEYVPSHH